MALPVVHLYKRKCFVALTALPTNFFYAIDNQCVINVRIIKSSASVPKSYLA
jgi:hypothetical protein